MNLPDAKPHSGNLSLFFFEILGETFHRTFHYYLHRFTGTFYRSFALAHTDHYGEKKYKKLKVFFKFAITVIL